MSSFIVLSPFFNLSILSPFFDLSFLSFSKKKDDIPSNHRERPTHFEKNDEKNPIRSNSNEFEFYATNIQCLFYFSNSNIFCLALQDDEEAAAAPADTNWLTRAPAVDTSFYTNLLNNALDGLITELAKKKNVTMIDGYDDPRFLSRISFILNT